MNQQKFPQHDDFTSQLNQDHAKALAPSFIDVAWQDRKRPLPHLENETIHEELAEDMDAIAYSAKEYRKLDMVLAALFYGAWAVGLTLAGGVIYFGLRWWANR